MQPFQNLKIFSTKYIVQHLLNVVLPSHFYFGENKIKIMLYSSKRIRFFVSHTE